MQPGEAVKHFGFATPLTAEAEELYGPVSSQSTLSSRNGSIWRIARSAGAAETLDVFVGQSLGQAIG